VLNALLTVLLMQLAPPPVGVEIFRSEKGLSANALYGVMVDPNGFVWVHTDNGLYRYDGTTFKVAPSTLGREVVLANLVDSTTIAALSFDNSIDLIDIRKLSSSQILSIPDSIKLNSFASTVRRFGDTLYVGTSERRLLRHSGIGWESLEFKSTTQFLERITLITQGQHGPLITSTIGAWAIRDGELIPIDTTTQPTSKPTFSQGEWWIAGRRMLHVVRGDRLESPIRLSEIGVNGYVNQMVWRTKDELWLATQREGLIVVRRSNQGRWTKETLLSFNNISGLSIDSKGAVWVSTLNNGLYRFQSWFDQFDKVVGLPIAGKTVFASRSIIVSEFEGAYLRDENVVSWRQFANGLIHYSDIIGRDTLIIGQLGYTGLYSNGTWSVNLQEVVKSKGLKLQPPIKHAHLHGGRLAIASPNGVYVFDAATFEMVRYVERRSTAVILLDQDRIVIGRPDRLEVWSIGSGKRLLSQEIAVSSMVSVDKSRVLVTSASAGLQLFNTSDYTFRNVLDTEGAKTTRWTSIFRLNTTMFALVGAKGLFIIELGDSAAVKTLTEIPLTPDGYAQTIRHVLLDDQGDVWFSTSDGVLRARFNNLLDQPILPSIRISELRVDNEEFEIRDRVELTVHQNRLSIGIAMLGLSNPRSMLLEYRFGNEESDWIPLSQPSIEIESIRKGHTTFEFRLRNILTDEVLSTVSLVVYKPHFWWELPWVIALVIVLAIFATVALTTLAIRQSHLKKMNQLAQEDRMRDLERVAITRLLTSHYLFNALATIRSVARRSTDEVNSYIGRLSKVIRALIDRTSQNEVDLHSELDWIRDYVALESVGRQLAIQFDVSMDESIDPEDIFLPAFILQPIVENAMFHGDLKHDPVISCDIRCVDTHLHIFVRNRIAADHTPANGNGSNSRGLAFMTERLKGWGRYHGHHLETEDVLRIRQTAAEWTIEIILPLVNHDLPLVKRD
jgi:ligand-binding sensor domain-containing protein